MKKTLLAGLLCAMLFIILLLTTALAEGATAIYIDITLNPNGGTGGTASVTATYDAAMPAITLPSRIGYTFAGYYDAVTGGTQYYNADSGSARNWDKTAAAMLYARWTFFVPVLPRRLPMVITIRIISRLLETSAKG